MADDDLQRMAQARIGRVLRGKYRLDKVLGIGGMAAVYAATHRNTKRFAIKMLHPELSLQADIRARFLREGYVSNTVAHPGAVAVLDDDVAEDGSAFLVMELLEGSSLDEVWLKYGKRVPIDLVVSIGDALLEVLSAAHAKGIVHRDIKPANLFLTDDGRLEVLDFGIARMRDGTGGRETQNGATLGTPAFMAPEQAGGRTDQVDPQTDLWAVGATLFSLITGELVHRGDNSQQVMVNAATQRARSLSSIAREAPPELSQVIDRALAFDKSDRWASADEMRKALASAQVDSPGPTRSPLPRAALASGVGTTLRTPAGRVPDLGPTPSGTDPTAFAAAPKSSAEVPRRSRLAWTVVFLAVVGGAAFAVRWKGDPTPGAKPVSAPPVEMATSRVEAAQATPPPLVRPASAEAAPPVAYTVDAGAGPVREKHAPTPARTAEAIGNRKKIASAPTPGRAPAAASPPASAPTPDPTPAAPLGILQVYGAPPVPLSAARGAVSLPARSFKVSLDYQVSGGVLVATLTATPWAIVYANGTSLGNSRERPVALPPIGSTPLRLALEHPDLEGDKLVLTFEAP